METMEMRKMKFTLTIKIRRHKNSRSQERPVYFVEVTEGRVTEPLIQSMIITLRSSPEMVRELIRQGKAKYLRHKSEAWSMREPLHQVEFYQYSGEI